MNRLTLLCLLALGACADPYLPLSPDFGNSVVSNIAAQVVNPNPRVAGPAETDGQRAANAIDRYRNNQVYEPHLPLETGRIYGGAYPTPTVAP